MNDSSGVLALLAAAVPEGPRDHELMSLHRLSLCIAAGFGMPIPVAGQTVVRALQGADQWEGEPPASLPVYVLYTTGPRCLTDSDELPERKDALQHLSVSLALKGCPINEVPKSCISFHGHAGRFLAVVEADARRAFGLPDPAHAQAQAQATPAPAVVQSVPVLPDDATIFNEVEALRTAKKRKTTAAVAEKYGVSVDTIERRCKAHKADSLPACSVFALSRNRTRKAR